MMQFKHLVAAFMATLIFCCTGSALAQTDELDPAEAEAVEFMYLFAELKRNYYEGSMDGWTNTEFTELVNDEQHFMDLFELFATQYGVEISNYYWGCSIVLEQLEELQFYCSPVNPDRYWRDSWEGYVSLAAYFEEFGIYKLKEAIEITDEQLLVDTYTEMLGVEYSHLLRFVSVLHDDPFAYEAQLISQADVDFALAEAIANSSRDFVINSGLNDIWYDPTAEGQGFSVTVFEDKGTIFLAWFTYDTELPASNVIATLGDPGQRWLTAQGAYDGTQAELVVFSASGGLFDRPSPAPELTPVGTIALKFDDCYTGSVTYELPGIGRFGSIPIQRVATDNVCNCVGDSETRR